MKKYLKYLFDILAFGILISFCKAIFVSWHFISSNRYLHYKMYHLVALSLQESLNKDVLSTALWISCIYISILISIFLIKKLSTSFIQQTFPLGIDIKDKNKLIRLVAATLVCLFFLVYDGWLLNVYFIPKILIIRILINMIVLPFTVFLWLILIQGRWERLWNLIVKPNSFRFAYLASFIIIILLVVLNLFLFIDKEVDAADRPNVIFITIDSLRADHLKCYGYERNTSPNIDRFANDGILFKKAISTASWTYPSMTSLFTSQYPSVLNTMSYFNKFRNRNLVIAEFLKNYRYYTYALVANPDFIEKLGISQGFDVFREIKSDENYLSSPEITKEAIVFLKNNKTKPFFLFLFYFDPHLNYFLHENYNYYPDYNGNLKSNQSIGSYKGFRPKLDSLSENDIKFLEACYDSEINFTDEYLGRLFTELKKLDVYDNSIIILTSDHGDEFMERGDLGHGQSLYQELIRVPLIIKLPHNEHKGIKLENYVGLIDIVPTLISFLGFNHFSLDLQGRILSLQDTNKDIGEVAIISEDPGECIILGQKKLIIDEEDSMLLYDLDRDPLEKNNLSGIMIETKQVLERKLVDFYRRIEKKILASKNSVEEVIYSEEEKERLKALGYL